MLMFAHLAALGLWQQVSRTHFGSLSALPEVWGWVAHQAVTDPAVVVVAVAESQGFVVEEVEAAEVEEGKGKEEEKEEISK
jgi:hypothetical protein